MYSYLHWNNSFLNLLLTLLLTNIHDPAILILTTSLIYFRIYFLSCYSSYLLLTMLLTYAWIYFLPCYWPIANIYSWPCYWPLANIFSWSYYFYPSIYHLFYDLFMILQVIILKFNSEHIIDLCLDLFSFKTHSFLIQDQ